MTASACGDNDFAELKFPKKSHVLVLESLRYQLMKYLGICCKPATSLPPLFPPSKKNLRHWKLENHNGPSHRGEADCGGESGGLL